MKITEEFLRSKKACSNNLDWFLERETQNSFELIDLAVADGRYADVCRMFRFFLNKTEAVKFDIFCAELTLPIFEDGRPREVINAAKERLEAGINNDCADARAAYYAALTAFAAYYATVREDATALPQIIDYIKQYIREKL